MTEAIHHPFSQEATIKAIKQSTAVLVFSDGKELEWPKDLLPSSLKEGMSVQVLVHDSITEDTERQKLARSILNEILK